MSLVVLITLLSLYPVFTEACLDSNCANCFITDKLCHSCNDGYWYKSGSCIQCPLHCSRCYHSSQCQSCVPSYWNPAELCNYKCAGNCKVSGCDDTSGYCYECKPGKYGPTCDQDCSLCINGECDRRNCTDGCKDGYVEFSSIKGYSDCSPCSTNCIKCFNSSYCTQCEQGFYREYYRHPTSGRGTTQCIQCSGKCPQCTSNDQCPECNTGCIKQECEVSGGCLTTNSETATLGSSYMCTENDYYEGLGHGIATGIEIIIVVGALIGVVVFFSRRTKCHTTICRTKSSADSREQQVYENSQMEADTRPALSKIPGYNEANTNTGVRASMSEQEVDTDREYISLGDRQPEHHYSDLQTK